ncbi:lamin tail domain-containing protein [Haloferula chungangensis]|uniref:Lamin tail domain-containing protein n=1 Tax=Haloferula chungangensis TaxID=1048331 RepID=A0ABW2L2W1_9BACT
MKIRPLALVAFGLSPISAFALGPGDIAFTGFNADANDDLAFVAIVAIPGNEVITITDNNWNGTEFASSEGSVIWTAPESGVAAGTVVTLNSLGDALTANIGTLTTGGSFNLSSTGDAAIAFQGEAAAPTSFLAVISNGNESSLGTLEGTGLTIGVDANFTANGADVMAYNGARTGEASLADYLTLINDSTFWIFGDGTGDQSNDGTAPDVPFDTTAFVTGGTRPVTVFLALSETELAENGQSTTLTIFRDGPTTSAATIDLSSSDTGEAILPATAEFLAGDDTVDVTVTTVDDSIFDGSQLVILTAGGSGFFDGTAELIVADDFADTTPLIINEIYPNNFDLDLNGDGIANGSDEFVELVNTSGGPLDISGWTISDADSVRHTFEANTILDTDCAILVFSSLSPNISGINGTSAVAASAGTLSLNSSDTLTLHDDSATLIMTSFYESPFVSGVPLDALNLESEITPSAYIDHSLVTGSGGAQLSPGTKVDGSAFCASPALTLSASPASFTEDTVGTASTGTIVANPMPTADLTISLASSDTSEAVVPATVTIPANTSSVTFSITTLDDLEVDGDIPVTLSASAPNYGGDTFIVTVLDDGDSAIAPNLTPGSIAFTGFNSDSGKNLAFVVLDPIDEGQVIYFTDDEWNGLEIGSGGGFDDANEGTLRWTAPAGGVSAGTVITIDSVDSSVNVTANIGAVAQEDASFNPSTSGDTIYVYQGTDFRTVSSFLAVLSSTTGAELGGTGLSEGTTAIMLPNSTDGAAYTGSRSTSPSYSGYLTFLGNVDMNWTTDSDGDSLVPFSTVAFTLGTGDAYDAWASNAGLTSGVNDGAEDDAENDGSGDGIANVLEFLLDGDPLAVDPSILPSVSVDATDFIFVFNRREDSIGTVTANFQWSTDLSFPETHDVLITQDGSSADENGVVVSIDEESTPDTVTVRVPRSNATGGRIFGRLKASRP